VVTHFREALYDLGTYRAAKVCEHLLYILDQDQLWPQECRLIEEGSKQEVPWVAKERVICSDGLLVGKRFLGRTFPVFA
jgi:hypothetical protein